MRLEEDQLLHELPWLCWSDRDKRQEFYKHEPNVDVSAVCVCNPLQTALFCVVDSKCHHAFVSSGKDFKNPAGALCYNTMFVH